MTKNRERSRKYLSLVLAVAFILNSLCAIPQASASGRIGIIEIIVTDMDGNVKTSVETGELIKVSVYIKEFESLSQIIPSLHFDRDVVQVCDQNMNPLTQYSTPDNNPTARAGAFEPGAALESAHWGGSMVLNAFYPFVNNHTGLIKFWADADRIGGRYEYPGAIERQHLYSVYMTAISDGYPDIHLSKSSDGAGTLDEYDYALYSGGEPRYAYYYPEGALKTEVIETLNTIYHSVEFYDYDGTLLKRELVESGLSATPPENPSRADHTFIGWDVNCSNVTEALTVTALYVENYTVTFIDHDGTVLKSEIVIKGNGATPPADPIRAGYTFTGWDKSFADVTENLVITALYVSNGGGYVPPPRPRPTPDVIVDDEETPLAGFGDGLLNTEEHYTYLFGFEDGTIKPNRNISRQEAAAIFFRLLTREKRAELRTATESFPDVAADSWSATAIAAMKQAGIIVGYPDGSFRPEDNITRAEFAAMIAKFNDKTVEAVDTFWDIDGHWAEDYITLAAMSDWILGYPDGSFRPGSPISRSEFVAVTNRMTYRSVDAEGLDTGIIKEWPDISEEHWAYYDICEATASHTFVRKYPDTAMPMEQWTGEYADLDFDVE